MQNCNILLQLCKTVTICCSYAWFINQNWNSPLVIACVMALLYDTLGVCLQPPPPLPLPPSFAAAANGRVTHVLCPCAGAAAFAGFAALLLLLLLQVHARNACCNALVYCNVAAAV